MNKIIKRAITGLTVAAGATVLFAPLSSLAVLQRQGPVDPANGFPAWYQDRNGIALELCTINDPDVTVDALLVNAGQCAIFNVAPPNGIQTGPEVFPDNFVNEHFYTLVTGNMPTAGTTIANNPPRVVINMGLEGAFSTPTPTAGAQLTFSRWRVQHFGLACTGDYTYYTPTNTPQTIPGVAGGRVFQTYDVGVTNPADVMTGHTGPFLMASDASGGAPAAPFIGPDNKKYLADATLFTSITGSVIPNALLGSTNPLVPVEVRNMPMTNYVAVAGPGVVSGVCANQEFTWTNQFSMIGRFFEGVIASRKSVDRATYRAVDVDGNGTPETFQIGTWATATQEAGAPVPQMSNRLWYTDPLNPASSTAELGMAGAATSTTATPPPGVIATPTYHFFGGSTSPTQVSGLVTLPGPVYTNDQVRMLTDNPITSQDVALVDEVRITQAAWNATAKTLTVSAESGAFLQTATPATAPLPTAANAVCSVPCLQLDGFGLPQSDTVNAVIDFKMKTVPATKAAVATIVVPNVQTPPPYVRVLSSSGGAATQAVRFLAPVSAAAALVADTVTIPSGTPVAIDIFGNDIGVAAVPALTTCTAATGGTCAVPNPATACVLATASPQCTALGGRISLSGNTVQYIPPVNRTGVTDSFYYQATTTAGTGARALVSVIITTVPNAPDALDDPAASTFTGKPVTIDVLANDLAAAGINVSTLRITREPCNLTTGSCSPGIANFTTVPGKLTFTPPTAGSWNMAYTFTDNGGVVADQGLVAVAVQDNELAVTKSTWAAGVGNAGTITANGGSTVARRVIQMFATPVGVADGCAAPTVGRTAIASATANANGAWKFTTIAQAARPASNLLYFYSAVSGSCIQATLN